MAAAAGFAAAVGWAVFDCLHLQLAFQAATQAVDDELTLIADERQTATGKLRRSGPCPRQDSNLRTALRRRVLYPLSYEGVSGEFSNGVCVARAESGERRRPGRYP